MYSTIIKVSEFISHIWFLFHLLFIVMRETGIYFIFRDYESFIIRLSESLSKQNILYVKIFQSLASNNNIIDDKINKYLLNFTNNAPWKQSDINMQTLLSLEKEYNIQIENNYKPINSGMISLVFKGFITNNNNSSNNNYGSTPVVIKMKRENIDARLNNDINHLLFCIYCLSFIPIIDNYQISEVINNNIHLIQQQTNFHQEIRNMQQMQQNCKKLKYVKIPTVYSDVTLKYPNIILMEHIDGKTLQNVDKSDYDIYAKHFIKFVLVTLFMNGCCHGDLHIGNILFLKDEGECEGEAKGECVEKNKYKIGILDFGIVYEIKTTRDAVFYLLSNLHNIPPEELATKTFFSGIIEPVECLEKLNNHHYTNITKMLTHFINVTVNIDKTISPMHMFNLLTNINQYIFNNNLMVEGFRIRPSDDLVKFKVIISMLHGVLLTLCNYNYIELVNQVMRETFHIDVSES